MTIEEIMQRDLGATSRQIDAELARMKIAQETAMRERIAYLVNLAIWALVAVSVIIAVFLVGYNEGIRREARRQEVRERALAEQDEKIAAEVRAMSNEELIAETEIDAANRMNEKKGFK